MNSTLLTRKIRFSNMYGSPIYYSSKKTLNKIFKTQVPTALNMYNSITMTRNGDLKSYFSNQSSSQFSEFLVIQVPTEQQHSK